MQATSVTLDQLVGQSFGDFTIDQLLGKGALSAVYLAHQSTSGRRVLLTVFLLPAWCEGKYHTLFMERFSRVASVLVTLNHPHILSTYEFGEKFGYPYLVTDFLEEVSLAGVLKQQTRCTPVQTLALLKQIAEALDYAHSQNMVYGTLKPANILVDSNQAVHITGLGLSHILEMRGIGVSHQNLPHLYSVADTLLYSPEYLAPEIVQGAPADAASDIYALGIVAYELLCGKPPFTGDDPLTVAMQHTQQPVPSLRTGYAQSPAALDLIIQRTLDRDPGRRYKSAGKLVSTFERVLNVLDAAASSVSANNLSTSSRLDFSERPTLPWFEADGSSNAQGSLPGANVKDAPPHVPGVRPVMPPAIPWQSVRSTVEDAAPQEENTGMMQASPPVAPENASAQRQSEAQGALPSNAWSANVPEFGQSLTFGQGPIPGTFKAEDTAQKPVKKASPSSQGRRKVLILATGGVVAAGLVTFGSIDLVHMLSANKQRKQIAASSQTAASKSPTSAPTKSSANKNASSIGPKKSATKTTTTANAAPTKTPAMNSGTGNTAMTHTGTVVGEKSQAINTASSFKNPADGQNSLLVHLPSGSFVAYERACTHQGVPVNYNAATHTFICPLHGSVFDPANGGAVLKGPAAQPLPKVGVMVNADGTITVG